MPLESSSKNPGVPRVVSFQPSFLVAAHKRQRSQGGVELGGAVDDPVDDAELSDIDCPARIHIPSRTALDAAEQPASPPRQGGLDWTAPRMSPPDSASPPTRRRSSSSRKFRKGSLSQQMQSVLKNADSALVRFSAACSEWAPLVAREVGGGGWRQCGGGAMDGDLQDPRNRTSRWVDVEVVQTEGGARAEARGGGDHGNWGGVGLKVARLRVHAVRCLPAPTTCPGDGGDNGGPISVLRDCPSPLPQVQELMTGYLSIDACRAMGVSLKVGQAMRIYDFVYVNQSGAQECDDTAIHMPEYGFDVGGVLMCTQLCERITLTTS